MPVNKLLGLGLFGESILQLIDMGVTEPLSVIIEKMENSEVVTYLTTKYKEKMRFKPSCYDMTALNEFFFSYSRYAESDKSGIFGENNGLLTVIMIILDEAEEQIVNWKQK